MKINKGAKTPTPVVISILPLLAMLTSILPSVISNEPDLNTVKLGVITLLLTSVAVFFVRVYADVVLDKKLAKTIICLSYLGSIGLLLFVPNPEINSFWMLGGLLVSMLVDNKLGLLLHFNLSFILGIIITKRPEDVIRVLIIGVIMSMLAGSMKKASTIIYAAIIILSSNITLAFAINNFSFEENLNNDYLKGLFSIFLVIAAAFLINLIYPSAEKQTSVENTNVGDLPDSFAKEYSLLAGDSKNITTDAATEKVSISEIETERKESDEFTEPDASICQGTRTSYEILCNLENDLLNKMKQHSDTLYEHSLKIGDISRRAALEIGADEMIAYVGGLYHDAGKMNGKNYIEEGLILAEEYAFPKEVKAIIKEHNIKFEKPSSVEAAIVMLADSVVSTIEYIEKNDEHKFTTNKIIENTFQMRVDKGTFDSTGLSLKDYKKLKEFFQKEYSK